MKTEPKGRYRPSPQPLSSLSTRATLVGILCTRENEIRTSARNKIAHLLSIETTFCLGNEGIFFLCGTDTYYLCLPANWTGTCTLVFPAPEINIAQNNQSLKVPLSALGVRPKGDIAIIPLLTTLGITAGLGTGTEGSATSLGYYQSLSKHLSSSLEDIAKSIVTVQGQIPSLAAVTLQNQRGLDLLTIEKGGLCLFPEEQCHF